MLYLKVTGDPEEVRDFATTIANGYMILRAHYKEPRISSSSDSDGNVTVRIILDPKD